MLTLETIKSESLWVAKIGGTRIVGTYAEVGHYWNDSACRDIDTLCTEGQPAHLRGFWHDYYENNPNRVFFIDDFYKEWSMTQ